MKTMRVELIEPKRGIKNFLQGLISLVTIIVAVSGIAVSYMLFSLIRDERAAAEAAQKVEPVESNSLTYTIEHLRDESLAIRMGALYELDELWFGTKRDGEKLVSVLTPFVLEHIQNPDFSIVPDPDLGSYYPFWQNYYLDPYMSHPRDYLLSYSIKGPEPDVYLAGEILSRLYERYDCSADLTGLEATSLFLEGIQLQGAKLKYANLQNAILKEANLQETDLEDANLQYAFLEKANLQGANFWGANLIDADLQGANLQGANLITANLQGANLDSAKLPGADLGSVQNLTAEQLLEAIIDDTTLLDDDLRAEYEALMAERNADAQEETDQ